MRACSQIAECSLSYAKVVIFGLKGDNCKVRYSFSRDKSMAIFSIEKQSLFVSVPFATRKYATYDG